jgi:Flp pilus assembly pilin Flp
MIRSLRLFSRDERGVSAVEFALLAPLLLTLLLGTLTVFDLFRANQSVEKATSAIGDIVTRQKDAIGPACLSALYTFLRQTSEADGDPRIRMTSVSNIRGVVTQDWSNTSGNASLALPPISLDIIPTLAIGDSVILTETFVPHRAFVAGFGLDNITFQANAVHRPRFINKISFKTNGSAC